MGLLDKLIKVDIAICILGLWAGWYLQQPWAYLVCLRIIVSTVSLQAAIKAFQWWKRRRHAQKTCR